MTKNAGKVPSLNARPSPREKYAVSQVVDGQRWNGSTWEPAGAEGVASIPTPRHPQDAALVVTYPRQ
jgi:hypothetical protein